MLSPLVAHLLDEEEGGGDALTALLNSADFWAPLTSTVAITRGYGAPSFTRSTTRTCVDHEVKVNALLAGEPGFQGARRVNNLVAGSSADLSNGSYAKRNGHVAAAPDATGLSPITVTGSAAASNQGIFNESRIPVDAIAGTYVFRARAIRGTMASLDLCIKDRATDTIRGSATVAIPAGAAGGVVSILAAGVTTAGCRVEVQANGGGSGTFWLGEWQVECVTTSANQNPSEYVPFGVAKANELLFTEALDNAVWTKSASTVAADATTNSAGVPSAEKIQEDNTNASHFVQQAVAKPAAATIYTVTWKLKQAERGWAWLFLEDGTSANGVVGYFNLATGATGVFGLIGVGWTAAGIVSVPDDNGYFQCVMTVVTNATATIRAWAGPATGNNVNTYVGVAGNGIYSGGVNLSQGTYNGVMPVGSVYPYNGSCVDGVKCFEYANGNTVAANVVTAGVGAAIATGTLLGYLSEQATTNLVLQSENFSTTWGVAGTPTLVSAAKRCGSVVLDLIGDDDGVVLEAYQQDITYTADAVKAFSFHFAQGSAASSVFRVLDNTAVAARVLGAITWAAGVPTVTMTTGTLLGVDTLANGVFRARVQSTAVTAANIHRVAFWPATNVAFDASQIGTIYVGGVQSENNAFCTSYVGTAAATTTRNQDQLSYPVAGNLLSAAGTAFAEVTLGQTFALGGTVAFIATSTTGRLLETATTNLVRFVDSATNVASVAAAYGVTPTKVASSWGGVNSKAFASGVAGVAAAYVGIDVANPIGIGTYGGGGGSQPCGTIRNARLWKALAADQTIQRATT